MIVHERPCLVVGGGDVALRKVTSLEGAGALVTVLSPHCLPELAQLEEKGKITIISREYSKGDLDGFTLVIAATNMKSVNQQIFFHARQMKIICNAVDDADHSDFIFPSLVKKGELQLAISSGGIVPFFVKRLRILMESLFQSSDWNGWWQQASELRKKMVRSPLNTQLKNKLFDTFFTHTVELQGSLKIEKMSETSWKELLESIDD